jgi:hypothetical protein
MSLEILPWGSLLYGDLLNFYLEDDPYHLIMHVHLTKLSPSHQ